jgi:2-keto-4-pentenoate hydratase
MKEHEASAVADTLLSEHDAKTKFRPFAKHRGIATLADAYDVQDQFVSRLLGRYGEIAGYKIGLTSAPMQQLCGINQPISGAVLSKRIMQSGVQVRISDFGRLGLEFEIGVRMRSSTASTGIVYSADTIAPHVEAVCAAIELVHDRAADYKELDVLSLLADNSWNGGIVLSEFKSAWPDLDLVPGKVWKGASQIDKGFGADVLGHPFNALAWLANHLAARNTKLEAGQVVLTGSLVKTMFPAESAFYRFDVDGIGSVRLDVST